MIRTRTALIRFQSEVRRLNPSTKHQYSLLNSIGFLLSLIEHYLEEYEKYNGS